MSRSLKGDCWMRRKKNLIELPMGCYAFLPDNVIKYRMNSQWHALFPFWVNILGNCRPGSMLSGDGMAFLLSVLRWRHHREAWQILHFEEMIWGQAVRKIACQPMAVTLIHASNSYILSKNISLQGFFPLVTSSVLLRASMPRPLAGGPKANLLRSWVCHWGISRKFA